MSKKDLDDAIINEDEYKLRKFSVEDVWQFLNDQIKWMKTEETQSKKMRKASSSLKRLRSQILRSEDWKLLVLFVFPRFPLTRIRRHSWRWWCAGAPPRRHRCRTPWSGPPPPGARTPCIEMSTGFREIVLSHKKSTLFETGVQTWEQTWDACLQS